MIGSEGDEISCVPCSGLAWRVERDLKGTIYVTARISAGTLRMLKTRRML